MEESTIKKKKEKKEKSNSYSKENKKFKGNKLIKENEIKPLVGLSYLLYNSWYRYKFYSDFLFWL